MMGMIKKDLFMITNNTRTLLVTLVLFVFYSVVFEMDMSFFLPLMGLMICISTLNYDDFNNWHTYASTLPQGRVNVVKSKYITSIGVLVLLTVVGVLFSLVLQNSNPKSEVSFSLEFIVGELLGIVVMMSILYPVLFKFGAEKGRLSMVIIGVGFLGLYMLFTKIIPVNPPVQLIEFLEQYFGILSIGISVIAIGISYFISKKIYLKKEF